LALLIPTASYYAYANFHINTEWDFSEHILNFFTILDAEAHYLQTHFELGASTYDSHTDGSGVCFSSRMRPVINMRPHTWSWQFCADTHLIDWLEEKKIDFDIITDDDLHREGVSLLENYRCVMTGTHPEYDSRAMMEAFQDYKAGGGRLMYMGGNGFYWKVDYNEDFPGAIEMRRAEDGSRGWLAEPGEYYNAWSGELSGLWCRNGIPPQAIGGTGFAAQGFDSSTHYRRTAASFDPRASFIFEGIGDDEVIGDFGAMGGGAAGWEVDRADHHLGTPPHALLVAEATDFSAGYVWVAEEHRHAHPAITGETCPHVRCDMVFFETPKGGAVFSTSSIAWSGALAFADYDNNVSRITENVVRRFLDPKPF
jgi:N,N-dimethylformamidase